MRGCRCGCGSLPRRAFLVGAAARERPHRSVVYVRLRALCFYCWLAGRRSRSARRQAVDQRAAIPLHCVCVCNIYIYIYIYTRAHIIVWDELQRARGGHRTKCALRNNNNNVTITRWEGARSVVACDISIYIYIYI